MADGGWQTHEVAPPVDAQRAGPEPTAFGSEGGSAVTTGTPGRST